MRTITTVLSSLVLLGCPPKDFDDFAAQEGTWTISFASMDGTCWAAGTDMSAIEDETGTLVMDSDGQGFTITPDDEDTGGVSVFECTLDGSDFTCEGEQLSSLELDYSEDGHDAVVALDPSVSGTFASETEGTWLLTMDAGCEGEDCEAIRELIGLEALPCTSTETYALSAS